ncbi:MAG: SCP2 sterol-binding domain-containing protein [Anaerolineae bacterium]|uniref:SCP2 sterol-binding domain-containing protein n=1 Tax=Promineifilum sp. TaxID=2664178 RepID=UPI001D2442B5|nr:SCP2 sterol-binding domain-containing protein [Anaerolineales bacterium]MCB8934254.1 SCP2 sterol-binding domain-containing protein [Promineifilum sp.]MCO5179697.1 SCP2 sterol-binding domain-containing protein [Promineifilum sp.]MCW5846824.1 SCP2 sterol-binding domain-containing protein [Anaerolineae bacterium]
MPIYTSEAQLYRCFQTLFGIIEAHDSKAADALLKASLAITFQCTQPTASITIDARRAPVQLAYGQASLKPTIEVGLTADTLHCLLLGEMRLTKAIGSDLVNLKGPVWKTLSLADIFHYAQQFYPGVLENNGLPVTCPGA